MVQLDALRAFAVFAVLFSHYAPNTLADARLGYLGVRLFFVLSGFLITALLLRARDTFEAERVSRRELLRNFYVRRWLRLFPLLALVLVLGAWADIPPVRETFWWHISYTSNIYFALRGGWNGDVSHLWSLAVEEQFYLIWPWVILFAPRRRLVRIAVLVALAGPAFRLAAYSMGAGEVSIMVLPFSCSDTLAAGALLALLAGRINAVDRRRYERAAAVGGVVASVALLALFRFQVLEPLTIAGLDVALAAVFVAIVSRASEGLGGRVGAMLSWQPLVYLGTISYGIYVYHNFVADLLPAAALALHLPNPSRIWGTMPAHPTLSIVRHVIGLSIATCVTAAVSWQFFELPINRLKHRFTYAPRAGQPDVPAMAVIQPAQAGP